MSRKSKQEAVDAFMAATTLEEQVGLIIDVQETLNAAFRLMNLYAQDPYDMGARDADGERYRIGRGAEAVEILAEVYAILAPLSMTVTEITSGDNYSTVRTQVEDNLRRYESSERKRIDKRLKDHETEVSNKIAATAQRAYDKMQGLLNELAQFEEEAKQRKGEVQRYLNETERYVRHEHTVPGRSIEL